MIYLDNASTTPLDDAVLNKMLPFLKESFANPASQYAAGRQTALALLSSRDTIAGILGCKSQEVYFVSGGTEGGNWALKGACAAGVRGRHMVISAIEHPAILESANDLKKFGFEVTVVKPDINGIISPDDIKSAVRDDTVFCAVMHANNETGVIQPVREIGQICREKGIFYYCDCVQTAGELPLPTAHCDALGISAHKIYGPKGIGVIYISEKSKITRLISGGKQERGLRAGTSNVAGAVGCAAALDAAVKSRDDNSKKIRALRDYFEKRVLGEIDNAVINGVGERLCSHSNISFLGCEGDRLLFALDMKGIAVSTGSACTAGAAKSSHVLGAMGLDEKRINSAIRVTFGKYNTQDEADQTIAALNECIKKIRQC